MRFSSNAKNLLKERYCHPGENYKDVYPRVAEALSLGDRRFEIKLLKSMNNGVFLPNSPCLRNAGLKKGVLHACFVLKIEDTMESISDTLKDMIIIFKHGGGVGINFSKLRPKDSALSTGGTSSGVVSFMKLFDTATEVVKQGGFRRGALMGVLNFEHAEVLEFIRSKLTNQLTNFNISVLVSDKFMEKVEKGEEIELKDPRDNTTTGTINAKTIFDVMSFSAWNSGDPGFLFYDRINKDNPLFPKQKIKCSNPCGETPLLPYQACVAKGTKIHTSFGLQSIEDIKKGEYVYSLTKNGNWVQTKVQENLYQGTKPTFLIELRNGLKISTTKDHKILTNKGWLEVKDLKISDSIRISDLVTPVPLTPRDINLWDMFGWMTGDGWFTEKSCGLVFGKDDKEVMKTMAEWFGNFSNTKAKLIVRETDGYADRYQIGTQTQESRDKFLEYGFKYATSLEKEIPESIFKTSSENQIRFLRGLFSADGTVRKHHNTSAMPALASSSRKLLDQVSVLLLTLGIQSNIVWSHPKSRPNPQGTLNITGESAIRFMELVGFLLKYKNDMFKKVTRTYYLKPFNQILNITKSKTSEVYDLVLDQVHNFIANGIVVHNCCLGSINLSSLVKYGKFDFREYEKQLEIACRALRNMNAISFYPLPEITKIMKETDPIGVGIMGFADCLIKLGIYYDSEECLKFIDEIGNIYKDTTDKVAKNCFYKRIIAPTGSLSLLADCSSGIEPVFEASFEKHLTIGIIQETRELYKSKFLRVAHDIAPEWHLKIQAQWQKWLDGSISKTINLPASASVDDVKKIYMSAWKMGLKGITVFRDSSKEGVFRTKKPKCDGDSCHL